MNLHVITPTDLKKFQIEHYSEMLMKPRSFKHKIFLRNELHRISLNRSDYNDSHGSGRNYNLNNDYNIRYKRHEKI